MAAIAFPLPETVVVTGTASGLGREIGALLLECGSSVIGVDLADSDLSDHKGYTQISGSVSEPKTWGEVGSALDTSGGASLGLITSAAILDTGFIPDVSAELIAH